MYMYWGFPGGSDGKVSACNAGDPPWVRKTLWRKKWQPSPVFLPGEFHGLGILVGYSPWGCKESDTTERLRFTYTCIISQLLFLFRLLCNIEQSSLCYPIDPCQLSILYIAVCTSQSQLLNYPSSTLPSRSHKFVLKVCESVSNLVIKCKIIKTHFYDISC